jgi:phage regulator Rha-like protein
MNTKALSLSEDTLIKNYIFLIRGHKVMLDRDLARLYGVTTGNLNKAVKRNIDRFPEDFMFQLNRNEAISLRFQFGTLKRGQHAKYLPYAFTEQGVAMLSGVLQSKTAAQVNIAIMRAFVKLREIISTHKELAQQLVRLENKIAKKFAKHDEEIQTLFNVIKELMSPPDKPKRQIGFHTS